MSADGALHAASSQVVDRHAIVLRHLRHRHAVDALQHLVAVFGLRGQLLQLLCRQFVASRAADGGQHLRGHPALEGLRLRQL